MLLLEEAEGNYTLKEIKIERDDWNRIVPVALRDKDIKTGSLVIINPVENTGVISLFNPGEIEACRYADKVICWEKDVDEREYDIVI